MKPLPYVDESSPANPNMDKGHPVVVFSDHQFSGGTSTKVQCMPAPHMHSQIEINLLRRGSMTYWFDNRAVTLNQGQMALFWGMIPHQVTACGEATEFTVIYVPMAIFLECAELAALRQSIFAGALLLPHGLQPYDFDVFERWRSDLVTGDNQLQSLVRDELTARLRRLDRDGWLNMATTAPLALKRPHHDHERATRVEHMIRFISEHALEQISTEDVAADVHLHPIYAMSLYKRTMGMTIKQSIMRHRTDAARALLVASDLGVSAIAFDCGFGSLSSFYDAFEQRFHTSPAAFRRRLRALAPVRSEQ